MARTIIVYWSEANDDNYNDNDELVIKVDNNKNKLVL